MKKKHLNEGCTYEHEETMPPHAEFISVDEVNRYMLQMTDEEQDTMSFRDVIAGIMRTKPESIKKMKRAGAGWKVLVSGNIDDLLDDNADVLKRLKDSDETTYTPDNLDDDFMWNDEEEEESEWMTPEEMGIAQKIDWSDDMGDEISDEEKMAYFQSKSDMYDVDMENGLVRLKPEDDWFDDDMN